METCNQELHPEHDPKNSVLDLTAISKRIYTSLSVACGGNSQMSNVLIAHCSLCIGAFSK